MRAVGPGTIVRALLAAVVGVGLAGCPTIEEPACPEGEVQDEETGACVPERCGTGPWGDVERTGTTVHVAGWGDDGGDGSEDTPFRSIGAGLDEAVDTGGRVAVAAGTYPENLELEDGAELAGRCAALVEVDASGESDAGLSVQGGEASLSGLTIRGGEPGLEVTAGAEVQIEDLALEDSLGRGLAVWLDGSRADLEDVTISGTRRLDDGSQGWGIHVAEGGELVAEDLTLSGNEEAGLIAVHTDSDVELLRATVLGPGEEPDELARVAIELSEGADLEAVELLLDGGHRVGLLAAGPGTDVELEDATVRGMRSGPDGVYGEGLQIYSGADLFARRLLVDDNREVGIAAGAGGTVVELEDCTIRGTQPNLNGLEGEGLLILADSSLIARDLVLEDNHRFGLLLASGGIPGPDAFADIEGATITGTVPDPEGVHGRGISLQEGADLVARDVLLDSNHDAGLMALGAGTTLEVYDSEVRGTQPLPGGDFGRGIGLQDGATMFGSNLLLEANTEAGLVVAGNGTEVVLEDTTIRDTTPLGGELFGRGIGVFYGADFVGRRLSIEDNRDMGLLASEPETTVYVEDSVISATRSTANADTGIGLMAQLGSQVTASGLQIEDSEGPGIYVSAEAVVDVEDVSLVRNAFAGAVVLAAGDLRLQGGTVSGSVPHSSEGGGVGIFAWDTGGSAALEADGVAFSDLDNPAFYLRGPGRYRISDCDVTDTGGGPVLPGGVLGLEGQELWHDVDAGSTGLLLEGNHFHGLDDDAILLDSSTATLDVSEATGAANSFTDLGGAPLIWQRCADVETPEVLDGSIDEPVCEDEARGLGVLLEYRIWLSEPTPE